MTEGTFFRPSGPLGLLLRESRAVTEYWSLARALPHLRRAPEGDGHDVVVLPGWLAPDATTFVLRGFLRTKGYRATGWGGGVNRGSRIQFEAFAEALQRRHAEGRPPVSLVGWSLGGICARDAAHEVPGAVRQVVSLSSPFRVDPHTAPFWGAYRRIANVTEADFPDDQVEKVMSRPPVPFTSIVSEDDAIVSPDQAWEALTETSETVFVGGTHTGLCHNPEVLRVVADRLALPAGAWRRFDPAPSAR